MAGKSIKILALMILSISIATDVFATKAQVRVSAESLMAPTQTQATLKKGIEIFIRDPKVQEFLKAGGKIVKILGAGIWQGGQIQELLVFLEKDNKVKFGIVTINNDKVRWDKLATLDSWHL